MEFHNEAAFACDYASISKHYSAKIEGILDQRYRISNTIKRGFSIVVMGVVI